ncbi:MAG: fatty acid desaturase [Pseudanabaenaceae cyanobacterium SKYGB_i_bin29]|nr:fatty acid desaturase [Pseudanabaenaceae cyanobacterium SKYG29]MDW8420827.1 fatty acid desaturase [Pseudanabaenaceae cyanobacterium SKYGB_i_bin29]
MTITTEEAQRPVLPAGVTQPCLNLRSVLQTLPPQCFQRSPLRAWLGVLVSVIAVAIGYGGLSIAPWFLLPPLWVFTGTALTGFFVLGHECGHRSFSAQRWVNDWLGHLLFLPLLYPFYPWRFQHDHHHQYTNLLEEDNAWAPFTTEIYKSHNLVMQFFYRLLRGRFWWLGSIAHWAAVHFDAVKFPPRQRQQVRFSTHLVFLYALIFFPALLVSTGVWGVVKFFLAPWLVYHFWMSTFTLVHHTMPDIPFKTRSEWSAVEAQLMGSVHCDYPWWVEFLCHDINWHIPHHLAPSIPFYRLRLAQAALEEHWGEYLYKTRFSWALLKTIGDRCHLHDDRKCYRSFQEAGL